MTKTNRTGIEDGHPFYISEYGIKNSLVPMTSGREIRYFDDPLNPLDYSSGMHLFPSDFGTGMHPYPIASEYSAGLHPASFAAHYGIRAHDEYTEPLTAEVIYKRDAQFSFPNAEIHYPTPIINEDGD